MKTKVGKRLSEERQKRDINQSEMADLLGVSTSVYARLERNETTAELDQLATFAQKLNVPIQEFLPETLTINTNNENGQIGLVMGNYYSYGNEKLANELEKAHQENQFLKEKITLLEKRISDLEELNAVLKKQT